MSATKGKTMILVEGPDGSGKSTLVDRLCVDFGLRRGERACTSEDGPIDELMAWVEANLPSDHTGLVYDRHPMVSEFIYGPTLRGVNHLGDDDDRICRAFKMFYALKPLIIYCLPPLTDVRVNVAAGHDDSTEHLRGVLKYTDALYGHYYTRYLQDRLAGVGIRYDYTGETLPVSVEARYNQIRLLVEDRSK